MTAIATRLVAFAGPVSNPRTEQQVALVQGVVAVRFDPYLVATEEGDVTPNADFWDVLVSPLFDKSPYVVLYEAEMQDTGEIVVKRDLFGPGDYVHNWLGWKIPGEETTATPSPQSREGKALAVVHAKRKR